VAIADFVSTGQNSEILIPPCGTFTPVRLAVMVVGPYNDKSSYRTRSFDWAAKARALLEVYGQVILVLPPDFPTEPFSFWRAMFRQPDHSLLLLKLLAGGKTNSSSIIFPDAEGTMSAEATSFPESAGGRTLRPAFLWAGRRSIELGDLLCITVVMAPVPALAPARRPAAMVAAK
jgi:hypothetical protein